MYDIKDSCHIPDWIEATMHRAIKIAGITVAAVATAAGATLVGARLLRSYRSYMEFGVLKPGSSSARTAEHLSPADQGDRPPTGAEHELIMLAHEYNWPTHSGERYGTDAEGPYLLYPIGSREARLQFVPGSTTKFVVVSWGDTPVTGPLAEPNPTYDAAVAEFSGA